MSQQTIDIERVVREVLAELTAAQGPAGRKVEDVQRSDDNAPASPKALTLTLSQRERGPDGLALSQRERGPDGLALSQRERGPDGLALSGREREHVIDGELVIDSRVVTMAELVGRLTAVRRVLVPRKAIVTPAVQDELLRRNIELTFADNGRTNGAIAPRLAMICSGVDFDPASLVAVLESAEGIKAEPATLDCLIASAERLAGELAKPHTLGLLLTQHTAAGLCLANRLRGVRAVTGVDAPSVATATAGVGANLLVVNPRSGTFFQLKQMVTEFCRGGVRPCPEVFCKQLG